MNRYTLAELVQQCDPNAENPADLALWDAARPVGNEVLDDMSAKRFKLKFPVTLTPDAEAGGFVVTFADIPEAITQGETIEEALAMAKEALQLALTFYFEDNCSVPPPSKPKRGQHMIEIFYSLSVNFFSDEG
jgi:predicted RNase H-like HicB family nuclease